MKAKSLLTAICLASAGMLSAATLNVELTVSHGISAKEQSAARRNRRVAYFVIDRSGSMDDSSLEGGRKPNDALLESLKMRLTSLPDGTTVYVIPFASFIKSTQVYHELDARKRDQIYNFIKNDKPKGCTVLYDAQDFALMEAARAMQRDPNAEISVYVYTDGRQETPWDYKGDYPARTLIRKKVGRRVKSVDNPDYIKEKDAAFARFKDKFADFVQKPNLEVEYEWLSRSAPPDTSEWAPKPRIGTELSLLSAELKNPRTEPVQTVKCQLFLPITDSCWEEIKESKMSLDFVVEGKYCSRVFQPGKEKVICKLDWPALPEDGTVARISLSRMPSGKKFELKAPKPLELKVPAQGKTSVAIVEPQNNSVVALGSSVKFVAQASDNASVKWTIPNGVVDSSTNPTVHWTAQTTGPVAYRVTASKAGLKDDTAQGSLQVVLTGARIVTVGRSDVGRESVFQAETKGECLACSWTVDGAPVTGARGKELKFVFKEPGRHKIGLTAVYKGITADAKAIEVDVSEAPFLEVSSPVPDGSDESVVYKAGVPIDLCAKVKGALTSVEWAFTVKGKTETVQTKVVNGAVRGQQFTPKKGGFYDVVVTAKGPAGTKAETFQIAVKSADVVVDIKSPKANEDIETGKGFDLIAMAKGPVKAIKWRLVDKSTAQEVSFGPSKEAKVIDGASTPISAKLPLELGDTSVEIFAEPILDDEELSETASVSSVIVPVVTKGEMVFTSNTMAKNWKRVKFGVQEKLSVETTGAISEVSWFMEENGKVSPIGKGKDINAPIVKPDGMTERLIDYFARGRMPDGNFKETEHLVLNWCCPCSIGLPPPVRINLSSTKVGRNEPVTVCLVGDEIGDDKELAKDETIVWYLDGKECRKGCRKFDLSFDKTQYGGHEIAAECRCRICGQPLGDDTGKNLSVPSTLTCGKVVGGAKIDVVHKKPVAKFEMDPKSGGRVANPWAVKLKSVSEGDVDYLVWKCDGVAIASNKVEISDLAPLGRGKHKYSLVVGDNSGNVSEADPQDVKVWNFWLALAFFAVAACVAGFFWWYFSGNDLRFWKLEAVMDEAGNTAFEELDFGNGRAVVFKDKWHDKIRGKDVPYWNQFAKKAVVPFHRLVVNDDTGDFETWMSGGKFGDYVLYVKKDSSGGVVPSTNAGNEIRLEYVSDDGFRFKLAVDNPEHNRKHPKATCLCLRLLPKEAENSNDLWGKIGSTAIFFALAVALTMMFAV